MFQEKKAARPKLWLIRRVAGRGQRCRFEGYLGALIAAMSLGFLQNPLRRRLFEMESVALPRGAG
jgi:hypothetical protein